MDQSSDWKMVKCIEWSTELPFVNKPRVSPVFLIHNVECCFFFFRDTNNYYLILDSKTTGTKLKPFSLVMYSDYYSPGNFCRYQMTLSDSNVYMVNFCDSKLSKETYLRLGYSVKFCFVFEKKDGPFLLQEAEIDEKSTQADLMLSLHTDVEYLSLDFGELLKTGGHSDVQLLCNGGNIPAHRAILAARSKAFSDMFQESTEESKTGLVNLNTTEKSVMEFCLEFIYKGNILNLPIEKASNLYVLGDVLKISSLTKMCADLMIRNLCEDNYISYLILSDEYGDGYFKCGLIDYICEHAELLKTENWIKFSDKNMKTAIDVYRKVV